MKSLRCWQHRFAENESYWCPWLLFLFWPECDMPKPQRCDGMTSIRRGALSLYREVATPAKITHPRQRVRLREIPMAPWVVDLLKRAPRRLHSDGSEFVFLTPEGKPMTDSWWPKRGAARRPSTTNQRVSGLGAFEALGSGRASST